MPRLSWSPLPRSPKVFTCRRKNSRVGGWRADPATPGRTRLPPRLPLAPRRPAPLTQVTKGLCRKSSRSSETVTSMSPGLGRQRREAAGAGPAHSGDKGAEPMARRPAARRALPTGQTMRGSSLPPPGAGGTRGAARRGPSSRRQQAGLPPPSSLRGCSRDSPGKSEPRRERGGSQPLRQMPGGWEQRSGAPAGQLRAAPELLRSGRPGTCGGARPSPGN